jgi:hypothetical protein
MTYSDRKLAGAGPDWHADDGLTDDSPSADVRECARAACHEPARDDDDLCDAHRGERLRQKRVTQRTAYKQRAKQKLCTKCGKRPPLKPHTWCAVCRLRRGQLRKPGRPSKPDLTANLDTKADLVSSRTSIDKDGRSRFHGRAERGRQPVVELDRQDVAEMRRLIDIGALAVDAYWTPEYQQLPRLQRLDARAAAMTWFERARRVIDDVLVRNGALEAKPEDPE